MTRMAGTPAGKRDPKQHRTRAQAIAKTRSTTGNGEASSTQKKRRAARNSAASKVKCPPGKEVGHKKALKDGGSNKRSNLKCQTVAKNRGHGMTGKKSRK